MTSADKSSELVGLRSDKLKLFNLIKFSSDELKYFLQFSLNLIYSIADIMASLK